MWLRGFSLGSPPQKGRDYIFGQSPKVVRFKQPLILSALVDIDYRMLFVSSQYQPGCWKSALRTWRSYSALSRRCVPVHEPPLLWLYPGKGLRLKAIRNIPVLNGIEI